MDKDEFYHRLMDKRWDPYIAVAIGGAWILYFIFMGSLVVGMILK